MTPVLYDPDEGLDEYRCAVCQQLTTVTHLLQRDGQSLCEDCADEIDERAVYERMFGVKETECH